MPRRLLSAAAACTLLLGLASCGEGGDGPVTTPPPEIDISAPSDGGGDSDASDRGGESGASDGGGVEDAPVAAPDIPAPDPADYAGMDENTPEGAEQAFRYYMALMIWGYQTGNVDGLESRAATGCNTCAGNQDAIERNATEGLYWSPAAIEDVGVKHYDSEDFDYEVGYVFHLSEHLEPDPETGEMEEEPRLRYTAVSVMSWDQEAWKVVSIRLSTEGG